MSEPTKSSTDNLSYQLKRKAEAGARILLGLDADTAGKKAEGEVLAVLSAAGLNGLQIGRLVWPAKDPNAWLQEGGTAVEALKLMAEAELVLEDTIRAALPVNGRSDDDAVRTLFAELAKLNPFQVDLVRSDICARLNMRTRLFDGLLKAARRDAGRGEDGQPAYFVEGGRILTRYFDPRGGETVEALCNFWAEIAKDVLRDNGQDVLREFHIKGGIGKRNLAVARVKTDDFSQMNWVLSSWGSRAIVEPGARKRDQLRAAIQYLSKTVEAMVIYTHTGWRDYENGTGLQKIYLTSAGAIGGVDVNVELDRDLELYNIPLTAVDPAGAMKVSLQFLDVAPDRVSFPLWGAMFLPPLRELVNVAFAMWIYGASGTMKSTYAALAMNHYGAAFDDKHLPANFTDTANRLEQKSFIIKDAPLIVDDFAPQKDQRSQTEYTRTAHRIVRSAGNLAGRGRLSADSTARATYEPRSLVMITGEDLPESESLVARLFVVELNRGDVDKSKLTELQGKRDRLPHGMSGYLTWLAGRWKELETGAPERWRQYRQQSFEGGYHLRVPEAVAGLMLGIEMGLRYALELKVIDVAQFNALTVRGWEALREGAKAMGERVKEEKPEQLFLRTLGDLITQGKVYFKPMTGLATNLGGAEHTAEMLGWYDHDFLYLLSDAVYNRVQRHFRDQGNVFPVRAVTLRKMLAEADMIAREAGRRTISVTPPNEASKRVLAVKRTALNEAVAGQAQE